jgi:signal transduction histidine kinase
LQCDVQNANAALAEKVRELETQTAELDAFSHSVAHDLKSPLSVIAAYADLLEDEPLSEANRQSYLQAIKTSSHRLHGIIDALLTLANVRREPVPLIPVEMGTLIEKTRQALQLEIATSQAQLSCAPTWPRVLGYGPWIEQMLQNYLSNALKSGGRPPHIEIGYEALNGTPPFARVWVRDDGPGLTPTQQAKLFTPFTRIHTDRAKRHGLGLSIVQRIAEKLGGQVGVESAVGQGSKFYFTLPVAL